MSSPRASTERSRAVESWRRLGRPEALRKVVLDMPISLALRVIMRAKLASSSPKDSAMMVATSLADFVTRARMASRTVMDWPFFSPSLEGAWLLALFEASNFWSRVKRPSPRASKVI